MLTYKFRDEYFGEKYFNKIYDTLGHDEACKLLSPLSSE
mgnify:CR=1 FL=1|tara:strand:+ start:2060 stop:2176 length:117 start_codon:yes stop_codon:yes gene_type:complete